MFTFSGLYGPGESEKAHLAGLVKYTILCGLVLNNQRDCIVEHRFTYVREVHN